MLIDVKKREEPKETVKEPPKAVHPVKSTEPKDVVDASKTASSVKSSGDLDNKEYQDSKIKVFSVQSKENGKRKWDKKFPCLFCTKLFPKLPRHYKCRHKSEPQIKQLILLEPSSKDNEEIKSKKKKSRKNLIERLRKMGTNRHNITVLKQGAGELIVEKRSSKQFQKHYTEYLPCEFCLGFYNRSDLHRHLKTCNMKKDNEVSSQKSNRVQGIASMLLPVGDSVSTALMDIFKRMKVDEVSAYCKIDDLIIKFGNKLCHKHWNNGDQSKYISNKLRELSRLTLKLKSCNPSVKCLDDIISPLLFPEVLLAVRQLCGWNEESNTVQTPSLGIKIGQLLGKISGLVVSKAITEGNPESRKRGKDFIALLDREWDDEISKVNRTELETRRWNKPQLIPLTEDLQILNKHLSSVQANSIEVIKNDKFDETAFKDLATSTLSSIIVFNRRRQGEASKLTLAHMDPKEDEINPEVLDSLTEFEKNLCKTMRRIEIRGKRGRKVPLILSKANEKAIQILINNRMHIAVKSENPYVFPVSTSLNHIRGNDALRKHVNLCELKRPDVITSTKLRKHIATFSQLLNLEENELEMLATFLGHDITVHREYYRLPEHTMQLAKCGKLLTILSEENGKDYLGKRLDEIDLQLNGKSDIYICWIFYYIKTRDLLGYKY